MGTNLVSVVPSSVFTLEAGGSLPGDVQSTGLIKMRFPGPVEITSIVPSVALNEALGGNLAPTIDDVRVKIMFDNTRKINTRPLEASEQYEEDVVLRAFADQLNTGRIVQLWLVSSSPTLQVEFCWRRTVSIAQLHADALVSLLFGYRYLQVGESPDERSGAIVIGRAG